MELGDYDESGRRRPIPVKGSEFVLEVDTIIPEIGYQPELTCFPRTKGSTSPKRNAFHRPDHYGDPNSRCLCHRGCGDRPLHHCTGHGGGYQAALSIDRYLKGQDLYQDRVFGRCGERMCPKRRRRGEVEAIKPRARMPYMGVGRRVRTFSEVNLGLVKRPLSMRPTAACVAIWNMKR